MKKTGKSELTWERRPIDTNAEKTKMPGLSDNVFKAAIVKKKNT